MASTTAITREHIHESNLIEGFDDPAIDDASMKAYDWLRSKHVLDNATICELQRRLTLHQPELDEWRGTYRDRSRVRVTVGGREGALPVAIPGLMEEWLATMMTKSPKQAHIDFEKIHPFIDGNGRVGRMLMWWQEKEYGIRPTLITNENKRAYYNWFAD